MYLFAFLKKFFYFSVSVFSKVACKNTNFCFCEVKVTSEWLHSETFGLDIRALVATKDSRLNSHKGQSRYNNLKLSITYSSYKFFSSLSLGISHLPCFSHKFQTPHVSCPSMSLKALFASSYAFILFFFLKSLLGLLLNSNPCIVPIAAIAHYQEFSGL